MERRRRGVDWDLIHVTYILITHLSFKFFRQRLQSKCSSQRRPKGHMINLSNQININQYIKPNCFQVFCNEKDNEFYY